jgi:hypothetical protein
VGSLMNVSPIKQPLAFIPVAMSFAALVTVLSHIAIFGVAREADEGAAAHIWQLLMAGQVPVVVFYVVKWLPRDPKRTFKVLGIQTAAVLAALAPVYWLGL